MKKKMILTILLFGVFIFSKANFSFVDFQDDSKKEVLVLRQVYGLCSFDNPEYVCLEYNEYDFTSDDVNNYLKKNGDYFKELVIENPSYIIHELNFRKLKQLKKLSLFGNDYDIDGLQSLPKMLLKLKNLESIEFDGVRFPSKTLELLKAKYKYLDFIGEVSEY